MAQNFHAPSLLVLSKFNLTTSIQITVNILAECFVIVRVANAGTVGTFQYIW